MSSANITRKAVTVVESLKLHDSGASIEVSAVTSVSPVVSINAPDGIHLASVYLERAALREFFLEAAEALKGSDASNSE